MKQNRLLQVLNLSLSIFSVLLILGLLVNALPTFYCQDDFYFYNLLKEKGLLRFAVDQYLSWDGRHFTLSGFVQTFLISYTNAPVTILVWTFSFLMASFFTVKYFNWKGSILPFLGILTASLIVLFKSHAFETIYWATGGVYSFNLMLGALWLLAYSRKVSPKGMLYILTVLLGATTQNLTLALMMIVFFDIIFLKITTGYWRNDLILILFLFLPGLIFISLAPGSLNRPNHYSEVSYSFVQLLYKPILLYYRSYYTSLIAIPFAFIIALLIYSERRGRDLFYTFLKYFLASAISLVPFIVLPQELSVAPRIYIYFQYFLLIALIYFFLWIFQFTGKRVPFFNARPHQVLSILTANAILIYAATLVWANLFTGIQIQKMNREREKIILSSPLNSDLVISRIKVPRNSFTFMHAFFDLTDSSEYYANKAAAIYYYQNSIITKETIGGE